MNIFWITYIVVVILNTLLVAILYNNTPDEVQRCESTEKAISSSLIWIILPIINIVFFIILLIGAFVLRNNNR